ncbi:MAG: lipopolysaccharide heptosyltransferase II [Gemmatimonadales bacterium]
MPLATAPRILAVRLSSIGDVILVTPLLRAIRARHPDAHLAVLTKRALVPLLQDDPRVNEVLALEPGESLGSIARRLRRERFTHCLDLHGSLRSRALRLLVPGRWRGYGKRAVARWALIHLHRDWYRDQVPTPERYFEAARDLDVHPDGGPPEVFVPATAARTADAWLAERQIPRRFVALAPGAAHATKRWPAESWVALATSLAKRGIGIVTVGGPEDRVVAAEVAAAAGAAGANAAGAISLIETAALLQRAAATVAGDTGVMHLATAVATPVVALFGPTVPQFGFAPYTAAATIVQRDLDCRPCSAHGSARCPLGHHDCLRLMEVARVEAALLTWVR